MVDKDKARGALERGVAPEVVYAPTGADMLRAFVALNRAYIYPFSQSDWYQWAGAEGEAMMVQFLPQDLEWWQQQLAIQHWGDCVCVVLDNTGLTFNGWEEGEAYAWQVNLSLRLDNHDAEEFTPSPRTVAIRSQNKVKEALSRLGSADYTAFPGLREEIPWGDLEAMAYAKEPRPKVAPLPPREPEPQPKAWVYQNELRQWVLTVRCAPTVTFSAAEATSNHGTQHEAINVLRDTWGNNVTLMAGSPPVLETEDAE